MKRQERRFAQRRQECESEIRKQGLAPTLDMLPLGRNTLRSLRDAAREYAVQDQRIADRK